MSAADRREELEAAVWQRLNPALSGVAVAAILAAADRYADAARGEAIARMTGAAAARLVQAAAEAERVRAA